MPSRMPRSATPSRSAGQISRIASRIAQPATTRSARSLPMQASAARSRPTCRDRRSLIVAHRRRSARSARRPRADRKPAGRDGRWRASSPCRWCRAAAAVALLARQQRAAKRREALGDARSRIRAIGWRAARRRRRRSCALALGQRDHAPRRATPARDAWPACVPPSSSTSSVDPPPISKISAGPSPGSSSGGSRAPRAALPRSAR